MNPITSKLNFPMLCSRKVWLRATLAIVLVTASHHWGISQEPRQSQSATAIQGFPSLDKDDWPWWRGPSRDGWAEDSQIPARFGETENVLWKSEIPGRGHSSPIIVDGRVYLATADEGREIQSVLCYELQTGRRLWQQEISRGGFPANNHPKNTEASSTIASDGEALFVTFFHHRQVKLSCLELSGKTRWEQTVSPFDPKKYEYGYAPSPVLFQNSVIVSAEHDGPSGLVAFDRKGGRELWRTSRPANISFSSPVVAQVAGKPQLLISGSDRVAAYAPVNGAELWSVKGTTSATCGTMIWNEDLVFASGGYPVAQTIAVKADGSGEVVWQNNQKCYEQSMILVDGHVYGLTDKGVLYCWRADDGQEKWRARLSGPVSASPVVANGLIYWANEAGTMYVFRANPNKFELVAENRLGEEIFASPALSGNRMICRIATGQKPNRQEFLVCIGES
ncbi:MAG: PQQ-binding-like beta-propeller repeat protein [bacterium]|nr:PQQ-binding-like beta-propeller repeat protein [bacterium]